MMNILLVEDDFFQATMVESMLEQFNDTSVTVALDGRKAVDLVAQLQDAPELIICDLSMPNMDGLELLRHFSTLCPTSSIAILSSADEDVMSSALNMAKSYGVADVKVMPKPLTGENAEWLVNHASNRSPLKVNRKDVAAPYVPTRDELLTAFEQEQFVVFYQPQVDSKTLKVDGVEALIRWNHPTKGILSPFFFLDTLIEEGFSKTLTQWVIEKAIQDCSRWMTRGLDVNVSVNVTPSDLDDLNFAENVTNVLRHFGLPPSKLTVEVTENELTTNEAHMLEALARLRLSNVGVSIDDFGTGFSTLSQLLNAPFNELKIDRSFVEQLLLNKKHQIAVKTTLLLAKELNIKTVVEGVEDRQQQAMLTEMGCDLIQGYLFSAPMPSSDFFNWAVNQNHSVDLTEMTFDIAC